jgi:sigma-B regulation protein RsbU (phosphoserine phosphatase)
VIPGVELAVRYRAAGEGLMVGGDFYDVFETAGGWAVALGDVCGKGPQAAALTGLVRHTIRTAAVREAGPSGVLSLVNRQIARDGADRYCTATYGYLSRSNGLLHLVVSCGGHPPPLLCRPGRTVEAADCLGTLLGVFPDPLLAEASMELEPGDSVVFYTDGVTDCYERVGEAGEARLVSLLWETEGLDAAAIADRVYRDSTQLREEELRDDVAIVVLRFSP